MMKPPAVFAHIPKTAGTTLNRIFSDHYDCRRIFPYTFPEQERGLKQFDGFELFFTHIPGLLRSGVFFGREVELFTCLRNPLSLAASYHAHVLREVKNPNIDFLRDIKGSDWYREISPECTIEELIDLGHLHQNLQVHWLANVFGGATTNEGFLGIAKIYLKTTKWFGIVERFDLSYALLCAVNAWRPINGLTPENVGTSTEREHDAGLAHHFAWDLELYSFANELLDKRVATLIAEAKSSSDQISSEISNINSPTEQLIAIAEKRYAREKARMCSTGPTTGVLMAEAPFDGSGWHRREYDFETRAYRWNGSCDECDIDLSCLFTRGGHVFLTIVAWNPDIDFSDIAFSVDGYTCESNWNFFEENAAQKIMVRVMVSKMSFSSHRGFSRLTISNFPRRELLSFTPTQDNRLVGFAFQEILYACY